MIPIEVHMNGKRIDGFYTVDGQTIRVTSPSGRLRAVLLSGMPPQTLAKMILLELAMEDTWEKPPERT